jgi:hypothetical protein
MQSAYHTWGVCRFRLSYSRQLPRKHLTNSYFTTVSAPFRTHPYITVCATPVWKKFRLSYQQLSVLYAFLWKTECTVTVSFHSVATFRFLHRNPETTHHPPIVDIPSSLRSYAQREGIKVTHRSVEKGVRKKGLVSKSRMTTNNRVADYEKEGRRWRGGKDRKLQSLLKGERGMTDCITWSIFVTNHLSDTRMDSLHTRNTALIFFCRCR